VDRAASAPPSRSFTGDLLAAVTGAIVHVHAEAAGRGATRARTESSEPDVLVCLLEGCLSPAERTLASHGDHAAARAARLALCDSIAPRLREAVAAASGREVIGSMSEVSVDPELVLEIVILAPGANRAQPLGTGPLGT
jgi:uncharacterized protein YbcI